MVLPRAPARFSASVSLVGRLRMKNQLRRLPMGSCRQPSHSDLVRPPSVGPLRALQPVTSLPGGGNDAPKPRLQATFAVPVLPQHVAPRTRLSDLIERTSDRLLTLVSAPAGYGKTTAV